MGDGETVRDAAVARGPRAHMMTWTCGENAIRDTKTLTPHHRAKGISNQLSILTPCGSRRRLRLASASMGTAFGSILPVSVALITVPSSVFYAIRSILVSLARRADDSAVRGGSAPSPLICLVFVKFPLIVVCIAHDSISIHRITARRADNLTD